MLVPNNYCHYWNTDLKLLLKSNHRPQDFFYHLSYIKRTNGRWARSMTEPSAPNVLHMELGLVSHHLLKQIALSSVSSSNVIGRTTFKAAVCTELGKPLQIIRQPTAPLQNTQIRVNVDYGAINFADILKISGKYQGKVSLPFTPGAELCGHVLEIGGEVSDIKPGDCVVGVTIGGGGYAEQAILEGNLYFKIKDGFSAQEGASVAGSYGTAYVTLFHRAHIKKGDVVLVTAAAGALGLACVDLSANVIGAKVIGVCGGREKCDLVKSYGAFECIDYNSEDVRERVKAITQGQGVDIAVDMVGGKVLEDCVRSIAFEGQIFTLGYAGGQIPKVAANLLLLKNCSIHGVFWGNYGIYKPELFSDSINAVLKLWQEQKIRPHVGKIFPLAQVNEALQYISNRQSVGKVLLDCKSQSS